MGIIEDLFKQEWFLTLLDEAHENAHKTMVDQMKINPDAIGVLYGDPV